MTELALSFYDKIDELKTENAKLNQELSEVRSNAVLIVVKLNEEIERLKEVQEHFQNKLTIIHAYCRTDYDDAMPIISDADCRLRVLAISGKSLAAAKDDEL